MLDQCWFGSVKKSLITFTCIPLSCSQYMHMSHIVCLAEHSKLAASLPVYGGSVYTRWGRSSCPEDAKLIYRGQMVGPDVHSEGGGSNFQCLPTDPDLATSKAGLGSLWNQLRPTYVSSVEKSSPLPHSGHLPCAVCEATQRVSQVSMPGKSRCPAEWSLEYKGYLMSAATVFQSNHKMEYVCIDSSPDTIRSKTGSITAPWYGQVLNHATAQCSGDSRIDYCPPYNQNQPLQCVICTK